MVTFILERHGQSKANNMKVFTGNYDVELTPLGYEQAKKAAEYIVDNYKVDMIYSSNLSRAFDTANCVAERVCKEIITKKEFREIKAGKWEGAPFDEIREKYAEDLEVWCTDIGNSRCTDGESVQEAGNRVLSALKEIAGENDGKTILVVTHATPIRAMQCLMRNISITEMKNIPWAANASITVVEYDKGVWTFKMENYDKHLGEMNTYLPENI